MSRSFGLPLGTARRTETSLLARKRGDLFLLAHIADLANKAVCWNAALEDCVELFDHILGQWTALHLAIGNEGIECRLNNLIARRELGTPTGI